MKQKIVLLFLFIFYIVVANAKIRIPNVIGSGMVLQQKTNNAIWGWANPMETIRVIASWKSTDTLTAVTDNNGKWKLMLPTPEAGGPYQIWIKGNENQIVLDSVWLGEVWVCSGQSNMEFHYAANYNDKPSTDISDDFGTCHEYRIHYFHIPKTTAAYPQENCEGQWADVDSNTLKKLSAVAYFFGKKLSQNLKVPIGLITSSWGGTPAEAWTPESIVSENPALREASMAQKSNAWWPYKPGLAYNAMIAPLHSFNIAGVIWYQGESNVRTAGTYASLFKQMIRSWRKAWNQELPFYYVQITPFTYGKDINAAFLREAQGKALELGHTGMVLTTDLAQDTTNIHPLYKHQVGYRLAYEALKHTYGYAHLDLFSPMMKSYTLQKKGIKVMFTHSEKGLVVKGKGVRDARIAGSDGVFFPAEVRIEKEGVLFFNKKVPQPQKLYYGFDNTQMGNIYNKQGLPMAAFRIDL